MAGGHLSPSPTFDNPTKQFEIKNIKKFKGSDTILIPSLYLNLLVEGKYTQSNRGAHAKAKYALTNLDPEFANQMATSIYQDLVKKLKASGWKVLTYNDTRDHPGWAALDEIKDHKKLGIPGYGSNLGNGGQLWMIALPDNGFRAQPLKVGDSGAPNIHKIHTKVARDIGANMLFPVYRYDGPVVFGTKSSGYKKKRASAEIIPAMNLASIQSGFYSKKGAWGGINAKQTFRVSEKIGSIQEVDASKSKDISLFTFQTFRSISKGDFQVTLDLEEYKRAILQSASDYNSLLVEGLKAALPNG